MLAIQVLDAPEAAGAQGGLLGTVRDGGAWRSTATASNTHGGRHGAEETLDERGHTKCHQEKCKGEGEQRRAEGNTVISVNCGSGGVFLVRRRGCRR